MADVKPMKKRCPAVSINKGKSVVKSESMASKNIVIILAGGIGSRCSKSCPKQFLTLFGKTILEYTLDKFQKMPFVDEICVVSHKNYMPKIIKMMTLYPKVKHLVEGGKCRGESISNGLSFLLNHDDKTRVIIHDAVRPLVAERVVWECICLLQKYDFVQTVDDMPSDMMVDGKFCHRQKALLCSGPEAATWGLLKKAYASETLCNSVQEQCAQITQNIGTVKTNPENIKITYPHDILYAEQLLAKLKK